MNVSISSDQSKLDLEMIHKFLSEESYWAKNIPFDQLKRSVENSLCFGVYAGDKQIGFARVISDLAVFAYLADVFILPEYRGKGLSKELVRYIMSYPSLQGLRRWMLATSDAHELYRKYGFKELSNPANFMDISKPKIYENQS
jgi:GNAT superfamily N-acetyltransferase